MFIGCGLTQLVHVAEDSDFSFGGQLVECRQGGFYGEGTGIIRVVDDGCVVDAGQDIHAAADWREILEHGHHTFNIKSKLQRHCRRASSNTELMHADNRNDEWTRGLVSVDELALKALAAGKLTDSHLVVGARLGAVGNDLAAIGEVHQLGANVIAVVDPFFALFSERKFLAGDGFK